jgi:integrase
MPAVLPEIERLLSAVPRIAHGRSVKTLANVRSRLKAALLYCADAPMLPPHGTPLTSAWAALHEPLGDLRLRNGLSRFVRIVSYRGLAPVDVDDALLAEVVRDVEQVNGDRAARLFWRRTATLWNEAVAQVEGWPQVTLKPPPVSESRPHLQLAAFPESFVREVDAYLQWAGGADPLDANAPEHVLKPATLRLRREQLRLAGSALARALGGPEHLLSLATLVEPVNAKHILHAYVPADKTVGSSAFVRGLAMTLLSVARHWVKAPQTQLDDLARLNRKLGKTPSGLTAKNQDLIRHFDDPQLLRALLALPDALVAEASTRRLSPERRLLKMRTALAIELLLAAPVRLHNLATLRLDQQLQWPSGRAGAVYIVIRDHESKNELPLEYELRGHTRELLDLYLDRYHGHAGRGGSPWLFVHADGDPVTTGALRDGITKAIRRGLNVHMTPHQFRHLCAAIMLGAHPEALGLVRDVLGHKSLKTTVGFYAGMRTRQAAREYDKILADTRMGTTES